MFQSLEISMLFCFHYTYNWLFYSLSPIVNPLISSLEAPKKEAGSLELETGKNKKYQDKKNKEILFWRAR